MPTLRDGPASPLFVPVPFSGNATLDDLGACPCTDGMRNALQHAPRGACVGWGIPFDTSSVVALGDAPVEITLPPTLAPWLVFMHTSDQRPLERRGDYLAVPNRGQGQLAELAAEYVFLYADGVTERVPIRRRYELGAFQRRWGENCFQAVSQHKPHTISDDPSLPYYSWGVAQTRATTNDNTLWENWLWAWQNPRPDVPLVGIRFEPRAGVVVISALSAGDVDSFPLRWRTRRKAILRLPVGTAFDRSAWERLPSQVAVANTCSWAMPQVKRIYRVTWGMMLSSSSSARIPRWLPRAAASSR